jgi:hypothetical protein
MSKRIPRADSDPYVTVLWDRSDVRWHRSLQRWEPKETSETSAIRNLAGTTEPVRYQDEDPEAKNYDPAQYTYVGDGVWLDEDNVPVNVY